MKKYLVMGVLVVIGAVVIYKKYEYRVSVPNPTPLVENIMSAQSVEEVRGKLNSNGYKMDDDKNSSLPKDDKRPKFDIQSFNVDHFQQLGETGRLQLIFFNDRLMSTSFYPDNYEEYLKKIRDATNLDFVKDKKFSIASNTDILLGEDYEQSGKKFFRWEDKSLFKEYVDWTLRYAQ